MATKYWTGGAAAVAQVTRVTFSAYTSGQTYTLTVNGKSVQFEATASTEDNVVDGLVIAIQQSPEPEFGEFSASNATAAGITLVANEAGVPFTVEGSATTGTATETDDVAATGPNFFDNADNWQGGVAPIAADDLMFEDGSVSVLYGIVSTTNFGDLTFDASYSGDVGLPSTNRGGYREYRDRFLKLGNGSGSFEVTVGQGSGSRSSRINIDANNATVTAVVYSTGSAADGGTAFTLRNTDASSTLEVFGGNVGVEADTSGSLSSLLLTPIGDEASVTIEEEVSAGDVTCSGGQLQLDGDATSLDVSQGAAVLVSGDAAIPTVKVSTSGVVNWQSSGGISTKLHVFTQGTINFAGSAKAKTVADADLYHGGNLSDPLGVVTWTAGIHLVGSVFADVALDLGRDRVVSIT